MASFGIIDFIDSLLGGGEALDISHPHVLVDAISSSGIDVSSLSGTDIAQLQQIAEHNIPAIHHLPSNGIQFGSSECDCIVSSMGTHYPSYSTYVAGED